MVTDALPQLVFSSFQGRHNSDLTKSANRLIQANSSKDLSTVCIIPNNGLISAKVTENWLGQVSQMNQKFVRIMLTGMEKHYGFNSCIEQILATPGLNTFKYLLTLEEDITAPFDGLIKLFENIDKYNVVGGLSWTKGIEGRPMIYGYPRMIPLAFTPVMPFAETVQECLGLGTGFTLFKLDIFKDVRIPKPWFRTEARNLPGGFPNGKPDLYFFENIHKFGYKVACDTRVKLGHYDTDNDIFW